ncbi:MAG: UDP-3-O-acyl-N-acetylglucosamine deacetylase [Thermoguttaceae bacterium]
MESLNASSGLNRRSTITGPHFSISPFAQPEPNLREFVALTSDISKLEGRRKTEVYKTPRLQRTIAGVTVIEGFGFWTGEDIRVEFHPAEPNSGIYFVRTDLVGQPKIPATVEYREDKPRQTSLSIGNVRVDMVEHLMAALSGLRIDNCEIRVNRPEMPGMDGSAAPFVAALEKLCMVEQSEFRKTVIVKEPMRIGDDKTYIDITPSKTNSAVFRYHLNYGTRSAIGSQNYRFESSTEDFKRNIMRARTFLTKQEADALLAQGICKRVTAKDLLVFGESGPIGNQMIYNDECARHKVLDMVGDFALAQCDFIGEFYGHFSGHHLNAECVRMLLEE